MPGVDDVFADAQAVKASDDEIAAIGVFVRRALDIQDEIEAMQAALKKLTEEHRNIIEKELPEAMDAANCAEFRDKDTGRKIKIKDDVKASISKDNAPAAHAWMRSAGYEDLIKNQLVYSLNKGQDNVAEGIIEIIKERFGIEGERKEYVHPQTLMAFCREQIEAGAEIPRDLLGVYVRRVAVIK